MKLLQVTVEGVRALADGAYSFAHPQSGQPFDASVITGASGSGKTTLLEAVVAAKERVAGYGPPAQVRGLLRAGASDGRVTLTWLLDETERAESGLSDPIQELEVRLAASAAASHVEPRLARLLSAWPTKRALAFFPAGRRFEAGAPPVPAHARELVELCVSNRATKFACVTSWLAERLAADAGAVAERLRADGIAMPSDVPDSLGAFRAALAAACPALRLHGLAPDGRTLRFETAAGAIVALDALSDGERDAVLLTGACARLALRGALLLIDRIDLHAGERVDAWIAALRTLAPESQVIATGTSGSGAHVVRLDSGR